MGSSYRKLKTILESNLLLEKRYLLREQAPSTGATTGNTTTTTTAAPTTTTTTTVKKFTDKDIDNMTKCSSYKGGTFKDASSAKTENFIIYYKDNLKCKKPIESEE